MSGIVNPYITISPRYPYPIKYYMLQEITGNVLEVYSYTSGPNIYSVKNPYITVNVPNMGVIGIFDSVSNISVPVSNVFLNSFTLEYFVNTASTSNVSIGNVQLNIRNNNTISLLYPGIQQSAIINIQQRRPWTHVALCGSQSNMRLFLNGFQIYAGQASIINYLNSNTLTISSQSYIADVRMSNSVIYPTNFTIPTCPLKQLTSTYFLLSGNFDQTKFKNNQNQYDPHNFNNGLGTFTWTGWLSIEKVNTISLNAPTGVMFMAIGSNGVSNQMVNYAVNGPMISTFNMDYSNVYAPVVIYLKDSNGTVCTLNGKNIQSSNIQTAQLSNAFKLADTVGGVLKNTTPPIFGSLNGPDMILTPENRALKDPTGNYLGYSTGFTLSQTKTDWVFTPTSKLNTYVLSTGVTNVSNVSIFLK